METLDQTIIRKGNLLVAHHDMAYLSREKPLEFALLRRDGFGASDSSILLGVNPYSKYEQLITEKCSTEITEEELKIGKLPNVRKGADLEPLILQKAETFLGMKLAKPAPMFRLQEYPMLTVNFDGIANMSDTLIPVEAKYVSTWGDKYWNKGYAVKKSIIEGGPKICGGSGVSEHIIEAAGLYGIPPYYYTQMQQQLLALKSEWGILVGLFDKDWEIYCYKIYADEFTQRALINMATEGWKEIQTRKGTLN